MAELGNSAASRDIAYVLHPYTNLEKHKEAGPHIVTKGEGVWIYDESGKGYIEGMAGLWCTSLGFGEQRLIDAATKQMQELPFYHVFAAKSHNPAIDLAEKLIGMAPVPMSKVFFANSGSEANDTAIKMIWYYNNALGRPEKKKIISRIKGYHGVTVAAASLTGLPANHRDFDLPIAGILHTDCPHYYRFAEPGETEQDFSSRLADSLEQMINGHENSGTHNFLEADKSFHMNLIHRYENSLLESIMGNIRDFISILGQKALASPGRIQEVIQEHQEILEALHQKDKTATVRAIKDHLDATEKSLLENL